MGRGFPKEMMFNTPTTEETEIAGKLITVEYKGKQAATLFIPKAHK